MAVEDSAKQRPSTMPAGGTPPEKRTVRPMASVVKTTCSRPTPST